MPMKYRPLPVVAITECDYYSPDDLPELVHEDDPAIDSMIDFMRVKPLTINENKRMYDARMEMQANDLHFIFVLDDRDRLRGFLSLEQILSEQPIKMIQENQIHERKTILVKQVMVPINQALLIEMESLYYAKVGNIIKTLNEHKKNYLLTVERNEKTFSLCIRGLFLATKMSEQIGKNILKTVNKADTLAQLQHDMLA